METGDYDPNGPGFGGLSDKPVKPRISEEPPVSAKSTAPPVYNAEGQVVPEADGGIISEADGRAAYPWALRNELEGTQPVARKQQSAPVAELPGSENFAGEQGGVNTLAQEANRQLGPGWNTPPSRMSNEANRQIGPEWTTPGSRISSTGARRVFSS